MDQSNVVQPIAQPAAQTGAQDSANSNAAAEDPARSFASYLKQVRQRLADKQSWLSRQVGCSDAAISFWESGARLPNPESLCRILAALAQGGASALELFTLRRTWHVELAKRGADVRPVR